VGAPFQFALKSAALNAVGDEQPQVGHDWETSSTGAASCPFSTESRVSSMKSSTASSHVNFKSALRSVSRSVVQLHGEMVYLSESNTLLFVGIPLLRSLEQMEAQGVGLHELPVHSHGRELLFSSLYQRVSAVQAKAVSAELKTLEQDRSEAEREREVTSTLLHSILPPGGGGMGTLGEDCWQCTCVCVWMCVVRWRAWGCAGSCGCAGPRRDASRGDLLGHHHPLQRHCQLHQHLGSVRPCVCV
jgi:hypothetical protein